MTEPMQDMEGQVFSLISPRAVKLSDGRIYSQFTDFSEPVKVGDFLKFKYRVKSKDGRIYQNIVEGSLTIIVKAANATPVPQEEKVDWDAKDRRYYKTQCLIAAKGDIAKAEEMLVWVYKQE